MNFYIEDPYPNIPLSDISDLKDRIVSLISRSKAFEDLDESTKILGSLVIVRGLDYHFTNYQNLSNEICSYFSRHKKYSDRLREGVPQAEIPLPDLATSHEMKVLGHIHHEAIAYFNRIGQFYYFAKSLAPDMTLTNIHRITKFRHKHSAHRSIDKPHGDSKEEQRLHAISVGLGHALINARYTITLNQGEKYLRFNFEEDHSLVLGEIFGFYEGVFQSEPRS